MVQPFTYYNPTKLVFGEGRIADLPRLIDSKHRILLVMGGGSIRHNGAYDAVRKALEGRAITDFWGIESNPTVETIRQAVQLGRQDQCDFVLAVGGGSVIDASKLIVAAMYSDKDPWEIVLQGGYKGEHLPLGVVLTIPATGSEMNNGAVISCRETQEKYAFTSKHPRFSILDPIIPTSLPHYQVACGLADTFVHVMEQYMTTMRSPRLMDRTAEGVLQTLIEIAPGLTRHSDDADLMSEFMLCATVGLNRSLSWGVDQDWSTHFIGHEVTALTGLTHGHTLAILLPATLHVMRDLGKHDKLLQYAARVWGLTPQTCHGEEGAITAAIESTRQFFAELGLSVTLRDAMVAHEVIDEVVRRFTERGTILGEHQNMTPDIVRQILELAY